MNIVILLAGPSDAFSESGHKYPKALVEVRNRPIIEHVVDNIRPLFHENNKIMNLEIILYRLAGLITKEKL